jgi:hypothetical protein
MVKWKNLNLNLRAKILQSSLRLEQSTSEIVLAVLRITKDKTKTLGNSSSNLSFKNKVDLIHDLGDLEDNIYKGLVKAMEIRNQFAHNPNCYSFIELKEINSDCTSYLAKNFENDEKDEETNLLKSYNLLYQMVQARLLILEAEYKAGVKVDFLKYVDHAVVKNIDNLFAEAMDITMKQINKPHPDGFAKIGLGECNYRETLGLFKNNFMLCKHTYASKIYDGLQIEDAFKRKVTIEELMAKEADTSKQK